MASWKEIIKNVSSNTELFNSLPVIIQDMLRSSIQLSMFQDYDKLCKTPILTNASKTYSPVDYIDAGYYLLDNDIHSFIIAENSTYTLTLLATLLQTKDYHYGISYSVSDVFDYTATTKYGDKRRIIGLKVKITRVDSKKVLRGDIIS